MRIKTLNIFWVAIAIIFAGSPMYAQVFVHEYNSPDGITYSLDKETHTAQVTMLGNVPDRIDIPPYISVNDTVFTVISFDVTDYSDLDNVLVLSLPSSLQYLKPGSINLFPNIQELYSWAVNPPLVSEDISERVLFIADDDTPSCTLYVPAISLQLYNSDPCWNSFTATSAIDAPITSIIVSDSLYITVPENTHVSELILSPHINAGIFGHLTVKGNGLSADYFTMRYDRNADYDQNQDEVQHINDATLIADNNLISANTATEMVIMPYRWNFISFPYDVKVSDIRYPDSADFVIRRYDGSARAVSDFDGSWKEMTIDSTLRAGEGYIIQVRNYSIFTYDYEDYSSVGTFDNGAPLLTFPTSASTMFSSGSITVSLNDYPSEFKQNRGWNFVGNPYPCCFDMKYTDYSGTYWVWDYYSDSFVSKSTEYDDYVLLPGEAFFIQCPKEKHSITFNPEGRRHERKEILHSSKVSMRGGYPALESAFRMPLASVGTHGYWNPDNPGEPGCNLWNPDLGRIVIDYYKAGGLGTAIDNAIGLTEGHTYFDETVAQIRGRVKEIVIVGPFDASDIWAYHDYTECMVLDLSRTTGWRKIPTGAFSESTLHTILLPECIDSIGPSAFNNYSGLSALHLHSLIPPVVDTDAFDSIPKGATAYVPASAYPLYLTNSIWSQINIAPFTDQVGTISVSLPSDWTDGRYKGLKIQATSNEYGHKSSFLITEKGTYQFNNLVKDGSYKVELKRNDGITLSLIDDIVASQDGTQALLPDIFNMYSDVVKVFTAEGLDITSQCIVKWYNADGGVIGENYLIKDITLGSKLDYTITLPERYALEYTLSDSVFSFTQGPENAVLQHALTSIPKKRIEGIICDANNGQPIDGAQIIASYRINGGYTRSFTAQSLQDGTFSMEIPKRDGILTVVADGFFDKSTSFDVSSPEPLSISMERLSGQKLFISLSYTTAGDEENAPVTTQGYSETSDLKYSFYNNEKCGELKGYRIQYPYIWFVSDTIDTNDCISVNVSSKKGVFETIETELFFKDNGQDTLNINIHERGRLKVRYASANDKYFNVILFNQEGNKISGAQSTAKEVLIKNIPEGTYTVVAASGKNGNISITRLEQLDELGLEADVDYVSSQAWVERGWINKIEFESLPVLDITSKNYLTWASLESEKVKVYDGDFTTLDCQFSFRPDLLENMDNVNAVIDLPAGCAFKKGSVLLNGVPADADLVSSGNAYKVIIPIQEGTMANRIRLSVVPSLSGTAYFAASVNFMSNDIRQTALIGSTQVRVEGIAIHSQRMTIKDSISISGTAPADASVLIYDGDKLIASTTASLAHQWFVRAGLVDAELLSRHPISAQIQSENGWVSTDTVSCLYNPYGVYNAGVLMELYSPQVHYDVCDVYESRQLGEKKIPKTYEPFSPGWFNNTTEGMAAKESIAFELGISRSGGGGYGLMPWDDYYSWNGAAVYFDAERGEAEPSYTLGNFNAFVYRFQAMFPGCDSTDVSDVVFHVILEDSVVNKIPGHFVEPGHWEGSRAYSSDGALPVNVSKITYTPKKTLPYDSIPSIKNLNALINEEYERAQKTARLHELKESALAIESRPELSDADKDLLQRYLNEGMSLYSYKPSVTLSDEQLQYIESIQGLDYEGFFEALKDLPGADISQDMIDYILGRNKDYPIYGTIEPREIYPGFYSPRVTYNFRYSNGITDILQPDHQWDFQYSDDHRSIVISDSEGNYLKLEDIMPANSSLVRQRGDEIVKSILPSQKDVDAALNTISNEVNAAGMASATVGAAADIVMNNFKDAANALGLAEGASVVGGLGE
ncbi:MAG: hypothetical protein IK006_05680, partial [Bacteroidaceae bacterium]|nr:hypothetical protein [Bacteroidaceae bacterium]